MTTGEASHFQIIPKPDWISFDDIHRLLDRAHSNNRKDGFNVKTAHKDAQELEAYIGAEGQCFVALDGQKLVGVTAALIVERDNRFVRGKVVDEVLGAVLPEYQGKHISSMLHERVVDFAKKSGINVIEVRTAEQNLTPQRASLKRGFVYTSFISFKNNDHYTVVMMKWLDGCPYNRTALSVYYFLKKMYVKIRFRSNLLK